MNFYCDHPQGGLTVTKRETSTDPGGGLVARISAEYGPQFSVVGEDDPYPAARDVIASRVGAVQTMETVTQRNRTVRNDFRLPCSDSEESVDDALSVGAVRPLATAAPLGGAAMMVDCQLQADFVDGSLCPDEPTWDMLCAVG